MGLNSSLRLVAPIIAVLLLSSVPSSVQAQSSCMTCSYNDDYDEYLCAEHGDPENWAFCENPLDILWG